MMSRTMKVLRTCCLWPCAGRLSLPLLLVAWALAGCAGLTAVSSEVSVYSQWPEGRKPATYAFERLPSQQAHAAKQAQLEEAARPGLEAAGFAPAADPRQADFIVQLGARVGRADVSPDDDPFWWRGGLYLSRPVRRGPYPPASYYYRPYGPTLDSPRYEREVAVLIRDRASNQPLYEARAESEGYSVGNAQIMAAMFRAAMADFPYSGPNPRPLRTELPTR